ncbi:ankyrin repeat domain-containing protein 50 [Aplysia californica]|uniref:Ankyrin repeat domain-containing protein 50 n=1 Tax=Aplysia californica TaxID=6500 RepID=A0ABM1VVZ2_APLCA|nr:ankyrin repeat domain-containing protein 50 [Aplysia californica]XP_035826584.1 ankyrin repeat domain-containing protein 50 [Aplysia californica]
MADQLRRDLLTKNCVVAKEVLECLVKDDLDKLKEMSSRFSQADLIGDRNAQEAAKILYAAVTAEAANCALWLLNDSVEANPDLFKDKKKRTALCVATVKNRAELLQNLLESGADPNQVDTRGVSPLIECARHGYSECLQLLLQHGARTEGRTKVLRHCALTEAASAGYLRDVQMLLDAGADINARTAENETALMLAAHKGRFDCVKELLARGANHLLESSRGHTALFTATYGGNFEIVRYLLQFDNRLEKMDGDGNTVLAASICIANVKIMKLLLDNGANLRNVTDLSCVLQSCALNGGESCLELMLQCSDDLQGTIKEVMLSSIIGDNLDCVKLLLRYGPHVHVRMYESKSKTLLHEAAQSGARKCLKYLLEQKANVNARNKDGLTPLFYAVQSNEPENVKTLIAHGADIHFRDGKGLTLAMVASCVSILKVLLEAGIDIHAQDQSGKTALMHLCEENEMECMQTPNLRFLVKNGARIDVTDFEGRTALMYAAMHGRFKNLKILLKNGASINRLDDKGASALEHCVQQGLEHEYKRLFHKGSKKCIGILLKHMPLSSESSVIAIKAMVSLLFNREWYHPERDDDPVTGYVMEYLPPLFEFKDKFPCMLSWCRDEFARIAAQGVRDTVRFLLLNGVYPRYGVLVRDFKNPPVSVCPATLKYFIINDLLDEADHSYLRELRATSSFSRGGASGLAENDDLEGHGAATTRERFAFTERNSVDTILPVLTSQPWPLVKLCLRTLSVALGSRDGLEDRVQSCQVPPQLQRFLAHQNKCLQLCPSQWHNIPMESEPMVYESLPRPRPLIEQWPAGQDLDKCGCGRCGKNGLCFRGIELDADPRAVLVRSEWDMLFDELGLNPSGRDDDIDGASSLDTDDPDVVPDDMDSEWEDVDSDADDDDDDDDGGSDDGDDISDDGDDALLDCGIDTSDDDVDVS